MKSARHIAYYILYTCSKYILTHIILSTVELKMLCMQSDVSVLQKLERKTKKGRGRERENFSLGCRQALMKGLLIMKA